jgi:hypothetical protein
MEKRQVVGRFWFNGALQQRPYYSIREITRGKKKGWVEVEYITSSDERGLHLKKITIPKSSIVRNSAPEEV